MVRTLVTALVSLVGISLTSTALAQRGGRPSISFFCYCATGGKGYQPRQARVLCSHEPCSANSHRVADAVFIKTGEMSYKLVSEGDPSIAGQEIVSFRRPEACFFMFSGKEMELCDGRIDRNHHDPDPFPPTVP